MFDLDDILGNLLGNQLGGGNRQGRRRKRRRRKGVGGAVQGAAFSRQGLTLIGGIAIAAIEHFKSTQRSDAAATGPSTGGGYATGSGPAGAPAPGAPPPTGAIPPPPPGAGAPAPSSGTESGRPPLPPLPGQTGALDAGPDSGDREARSADTARAGVIVHAMINAAKADGQIDAEERRIVLERLDKAQVGEAARAWVLAELETPFDLDSVVDRVHDQELAAEVYVASLLTIDEQVPVETEYLDQLASRLGLEAGLVADLREQVDAEFEVVEGED